LPIFEPANLQSKTQTKYMRGLLQNKKASTQFLLLVCVAVVSFIILGVLIGAQVLSVVTGVSILEMSDPQNMDASNTSIIHFIRGMSLIQFITLFIIPVFFCVRLFSNNTRQYLGFQKPYDVRFIVAGLLLMILSYPLVQWLGNLNQNINFPDSWEAWFRKTEESAGATTNALLSRRTVKDLLLNIFFIAVLAGVGEELLFRGLVQRLFIRMFKSPLAGIIVTAILFSAMHVQFFGFFPRLLLGICLGMIYWYSGSLWLAIAAHIMYNATIILLIYFDLIGTEAPTGISKGLILPGTISLIAVLLIIAWMKKTSPVSYERVYAADDLAVKDHPF
jgi:membrane protease YdiL (CAAX protease family)